MVKLKVKPEDFVVEEVIDVTHEKDDALVFTLEKTNWDTIRAIKVIARQLRVSEKRFGYAGLKDRRAVTRQKVSVSGVEKENIERMRIPRIRVYGIEKGDRIRLGDHRGNAFDILVRDAQLQGEGVKTFPNFFGVQRFGEVRPITHEVGRALVKGVTEEAAFIFLAKPFPGERGYEARKALWETRDYNQAKKEFPLHLTYERAMLERIHLGAKEAFRALPLRLNTLFIHAYQAFLFNRILKKRCESVPLECVEEKDVVISAMEGKKVFTLAGAHNIERIRAEGLCAAGPVVGYKTVVRGHMKKLCDAVLEEEGIKREDFRLKDFPVLSSRGTYREIVGKAADFSYENEDEGVRVKFFLPKGQYATVFLEELFKEPVRYSHRRGKAASREG